jgi:predicted nucleic acid-binding protein
MASTPSASLKTSWSVRHPLPDVICNTSPFQYLHQIGHLELLPKLVSRIVVPTAVADELAEGRRRGLDLPIPEDLPWVDMRTPSSEHVVRLVADLGPGETGVLFLALERTDAVVILDDALARRHAEMLGISLTGTLGVLLDAKRCGLVSALTPLIDDLQRLGFRLSDRTRQAVLRKAAEL